MLPDLPKATYRVWVRGYGLVDSPKVTTEPGKILNLTAVVAPNLAAAAQYYPAIYWFSMIRIPDRSRFPGTGADGNGIPVTFKTQDQWLDTIKTNGCGNCHQIGNYATRTIPAGARPFRFVDRRLGAAPAVRTGRRDHDRHHGAPMLTPDGGHLAALADWTDRIKAGELPSATPPRPTGVERNLVVTVRDWSDPKHYLHDLTLTDKRNPTVNGYGLIYGAAELSTDNLPILDPVHNTKTVMKVPVARSEIHAELGARQSGAGAVALLGHRADLGQPGQRPQSDDGPGRPGLFHGADSARPRTRRITARANLPLRSAQLYPLAGTPDGFVQNARQVTVYDPEDQEVLVHRHLLRHPSSQFRRGCRQHAVAEQQQPGQSRRGRLDQHQDVSGRPATRRSRRAGRALIVDTNGNGKRDEGYNEPGRPADSAKDTRIPFGMYGIS